MTLSLFKHLLSGLALLLAASTASAQLSVEVDGNVVTADVDLNGVRADITITFDQAIGLNAQSIGLDIDLVDITDTALLARLPATGMGIPAAFPLKLVIEPPDELGLSFVNTAQVEIHTHALTLTTQSPLRLLKAPLGGDFEDITESLAAGSVRSRGRTGGFSEFVIGVEVRPHATVAVEKFDAIDAELANPSIPAALAADLASAVDAAEAAFEEADYVGAVDELMDFIDLVRNEQGQGLANVWRATRDLDNIAGRLEARARTLIFTLRMANSL